MIKTKCPECGKVLEAPDEAAGGKGKRPDCGVFGIIIGIVTVMTRSEKE